MSLLRYFLLGRCQPGILRCLPRATLNSLSATFLTITEPAPVVAISPMVTGATNEVFEPIKAPAPIMVFDLFMPS